MKTNEMSVGWNLGNTLDAHWNARPYVVFNTPEQQETYWGNPITTKAMIDFLKAEGFNTIRVPVTWYMFTGPAPEYKIADAWMNRVQEVVDYVISSGLFCILNVHHEDYQKGKDDQGEWEIGWLKLYHADGTDREPLPTGRPNSAQEKAEMNKHFASLWKQIAARFKDYDENLIFEGINEPRSMGLKNNSRKVWAEQGNFLNGLLQTFVDTVRSSGGKNTDRYLMVSPFYASVGMDSDDRDGRIADFVDPKTGKLRVKDPRPDCSRLIASLHYYEPWGFVTAPKTSPYYSETFDLSKPSISGSFDNMVKIIQDNFLKNGIPVIMGETGALRRKDIPGHDAERAKWAEYYTARLKEIGVPVIIWDDGGMFRLFDRAKLKWEYPDIAKALVAGSKTRIKE